MAVDFYIKAIRHEDGRVACYCIYDGQGKEMFTYRTYPRARKALKAFLESGLGIRRKMPTIEASILRALEMTVGVTR